MVARKCLEDGMTYREAAATFGVSHGSVHQFILKYKTDKTNAQRRVRKKELGNEVDNYRHQAQVKELKHEIAELYLENLLLKKALKHSLQSKSEDSSIVTSENLDQLQEDAD